MTRANFVQEAMTDGRARILASQEPETPKVLGGFGEAVIGLVVIIALAILSAYITGRDTAMIAIWLTVTWNVFHIHAAEYLAAVQGRNQNRTNANFLLWLRRIDQRSGDQATRPTAPARPGE